LNIIDHFVGGIFATVMDSYDYQRALDEVVPSVAAEKVAKGGFWVLRPDSGDPVDAVLAGLIAADKTFGSDINTKGYKVTKGVGVIQGDGIDHTVMEAILKAVLKAGFSAQSVAFGMGGGLLQKLNRDTLSFATKLCHIVSDDDIARDVFKKPKTDTGKLSFPGILAVKRVDGVPTVFPGNEVSAEENLLKVIYDKGPVKGLKWESFDELRERVEREWAALPPTADVISESLKRKQQEMAAALK
jgi:nicotinamide phosphoribosyltransferase